MPIVRAIAAHPWTSLQDILLLCMVMIGATQLAIEYEMFRLNDTLQVSDRRVRLEELIVLSSLMLGGVVAFVLRRKHEARRDDENAQRTALELTGLRDEAYRDPLTGLPNRRALLTALGAAAKGPSQDKRTHAFYLLDLDGFKRVNDEMGHMTGDHVLKLVVDRLRAAARPSDLIGRLGGDEFAVLAYDVDCSAAERIGERFIAALGGPIVTEQCSHHVGVSIGVALIPLDGITTEEIIANADRAMYRAKRQSGSAIAFCKGSHGVFEAVEKKRKVL